MPNRSSAALVLLVSLISCARAEAAGLSVSAHAAGEVSAPAPWSFGWTTAPRVRGGIEIAPADRPVRLPLRDQEAALDAYSGGDRLYEWHEVWSSEVQGRIGEWLASPGARTLIDSSDVKGRVGESGVAVPQWATDLLGLSAPDLRWSRARIWPWCAGGLALRQSGGRVGVPGAMPSLPTPVSVDLVDVPLAMALSDLAATDLRTPLLSADRRFDRFTVSVHAEGARLDEALLALGGSVGGEWRQVGSDLFLAFEHTTYVGFEGAATEPQHYGWAECRLVVPLVACMHRPDIAASWPLTPAYPVLDLEFEEPGGTMARVYIVVLEACDLALQALGGAGEPFPAGAARVALTGYGAAVGKSIAIEPLADPNGPPLSPKALQALAEAHGIPLARAKATTDAPLGPGNGPRIVQMRAGAWLAVTDCDSAFVTLLGADGRRARFPKDALESGMSGIMFVAPALLDERPAALRAPGGMFGIG